MTKRSFIHSLGLASLFPTIFTPPKTSAVMLRVKFQVAFINSKTKKVFRQFEDSRKLEVESASEDPQELRELVLQMVRSDREVSNFGLVGGGYFPTFDIRIKEITSLSIIS